jgi:hypothetical protein
MSPHQVRLGWSGSNSRRAGPAQVGAGMWLGQAAPTSGPETDEAVGGHGRSARLWFTGQPRRGSSAVHAWCPIDPSESTWMTRISAARSACSRLVSIGPCAPGRPNVDAEVDTLAAPQAATTVAARSRPPAPAAGLAIAGQPVLLAPVNDGPPTRAPSVSYIPARRLCPRSAGRPFGPAPPHHVGTPR